MDNDYSLEDSGLDEPSEVQDPEAYLDELANSSDYEQTEMPIDQGDLGTEPVEIQDVPDGPNSDSTFHPRPGGFETLPDPEGEPIGTPHTPEIPYGGGPEGRW